VPYLEIHRLQLITAQRTLAFIALVNKTSRQLQIYSQSS